VLRLHALGGLYLERDGVRIDGGATQRKRLALLAVLAVEQSGATRDKVAALLWPESDVAHSRNALYQSVAAIRRELGSEVVIGSPTGDLRLNPELLTSDVADFQDALARDDLERAAAVYGGAFLDGVHIRSAPELERWVEVTARTYQRRYQDVLGELADRALASGGHGVAARWLRRLAEADPLNAGSAVRLMEALAAAGEREAAIRHGAVYTELVRAELDVEPDRRVLEILAGLRRREDAGERRHGVRPLVRSVEETEGKMGDLTSPGPSTDGSASPPLRRWRWRLAAALVITGAAASALALRRASHPGDPANASLDPKAVVVADFENLTGDSSFNLLGATLGDWVTQGVMQTGVARVIDPASRAAVGRLGSSVSALKGKARVFAMAKAAAAGLVVSGSIFRQGSDLAIHAQLTDVRNDQVLAWLEPIAAPIGFPLQNADLLRERIAGAIASAFDQRLTIQTLPSGHPPTFAAYQEYVLGLDTFVGIEELPAVPHFIRAAQLDTTWGLPLVWAAFAYSNSGQGRELDSVLAALEKRRKFLGPLEELHLQEFRTKDPDANLVITLRGAKLSPGSTWSMGAGGGMHNRNRMREAIAYYRQIDPEHGWVRTWRPYWLYYTRALHAVGDYRDELSVVRRFRALAPTDPSGAVIEIRALASLGKLTEARRRLADLLRQTDADCAGNADLNQQLGLELTTHGDAADADSVYERILRTCQRDDERLIAFAGAKDSVARAGARVWLGVALYRLRRYDEARRTLAWAIAQPAADPDTRLEATKFLGRIAARQGDRAGAERAMRSFPSDPIEGESYASIEYAAIATLLGDRERAMQRLVAASDRLPYARLHRDPDFDSLRGYRPFDALVTPK
jgi:DNA-binding SARP family transcriptional activator/TolB-like protein